MFEAFLADLQRRHLFRTAGVYAVAAWGVFQVAHTLFETFQLPEWTSALTFVVLLLGLPVVLTAAWFHARREAPAGGQTGEGATAAPGRRFGRFDMLLLAAVLVLGGLAGAQIGGRLSGGKATILGSGAPQKSVAVLPFVAFSEQKDSEYFADGLTEEVINSLAQVPDLKVAGRTSAFYFKGRNEDLREVGKRLGVAHVVEGSVRREGDRLRVTAQLVSVKDGFHVWSKTYDRTLDDAFAIQSEIGQAVAEALKTKLDVQTAAKGAARDPTAYQLELTSRAHLARRGRDELEAARAGYEQLMTLEPNNAAGYAGYARATITLAQNHLDLDFDQARRVSEAAVQKAIQLAPNSSDVWLARATVSRVLSLRIGGAQYERDFDQAVRRAVVLNPRSSEALTLYASRLADVGKAPEAEAAARRAVAADPLSRSALMALGKASLRVGKLEESERQYRSVTALYPDFAEGKYQLAAVLVERGRLDLAEPWLRAVSQAGDDPYIAFQTAWLYTNLGLPEDAHKVVVAIKGSPGKELGQAGEFAVRGDWAGMARFGRALMAKDPEPFWPMVVFQGEAMTGHWGAALEALKKARPDLLQPDAAVSTTDINMPILVAHVLRQHGDVAQAERLLDRVLAATAPAPGQRTPNDWRIARAKAFAERGQTRESIAEIEAAVKAGWRTPYLFDDSLWLDQVPGMSRVRQEPRFKALMAQVREDLARQRAAVLALRRSTDQPTA